METMVKRDGKTLEGKRAKAIDQRTTERAKRDEREERQKKGKKRRRERERERQR